MPQLMVILISHQEWETDIWYNSKLVLRTVRKIIRSDFISDKCDVNWQCGYGTSNYCSILSASNF